ncbi:GOLPH3/VPS74 family protein [Parvibaculum sp.]|uniref:GOLPH3/VPS74 family protein n=1 Tax=Parvibaculum sp. TaxID=2024848 RepID=UPI002CD519A9|nr:GPP34 family phosphoprotein [Parvibaculum sp.]HUD51403.1 GPP34 family phosphoprotein [Parvibaculum sp.]
MLTVPEEFLLLTVKDDEGGFVDIPREAVSAGFIGAAIMELALQNRIDSDLDRIWIVDKAPTGEACVDLVLQQIAAPGFDLEAAKLIDQLVVYGNQVRELALDRLCERKILAKAEGRVLWFLKARRYPVVDGKEIREVKLRLLEILLRDELPDPRDVCLMSLAETCGIIRQIVPASELKRASERLATLAKMDLIGQNVTRYITIFQEAVAYAAYTWPM